MTMVITFSASVRETKTTGSTMRILQNTQIDCRTKVPSMAFLVN